MHDLNDWSVYNVFALHSYLLCLQQRILYCNYFEIWAWRNAMSTISGDCFSCWTSEPWWGCYKSSLEANKILLTTWELRELLVGNNLLIRFSLFFHLQFVCKYLVFFSSQFYSLLEMILWFSERSQLSHYRQQSHYRHQSMISKN